MPPSLPASAKLPRFELRFILVFIGFNATVAQIVLMRELMTVAYGNEISLGLMLASWLLWTALGSSVLGRAARFASDPAKLMAILQLLLAVAFPATIVAVRFSRSWFRAIPGELLGPVEVFLICLFGLSILCLLSGWTFVVGVRLYQRESASTTSTAVNFVYLLEAAGAAVGGLLSSLLLLRFLSTLQIAFLASTLNLMAVTVLRARKRALRIAAISLLLIAWASIGLTLGRRLEFASLARTWPGFDLLDARNSPYGNLTVVEADAMRSVFENGIAIFSAPDAAAAEEAVHFALLEHPSPTSLLLIGGGPSGALQQALQHKTVQKVDYVELDPVVLQLAEQYFPEQWRSARADPRVRVHSGDGRLFLKTTGDSFDVIIVNLPAPETAQLNRFYTAEFFNEARQKLAEGGVFSFQLHAAEEYLSPDLSAFLRCITRSLQTAFPIVHAIPGGVVHFFAAKRTGVLAADSAELLARLHARRLQTSYVRDYYFRFRVMPDRIADLQEKIRPSPETPLNNDLIPIAYYFDVALWSTQFNREYQHVFETVAQFRFPWIVGCGAVALLVVVAFIYLRPRSSFSCAGGAGLCVAITGLTMIAIEMLLLLGFQAVYGYVYQQLAILLALFMAGMALGTWSKMYFQDAATQVSRAPMRSLAALQALVAISSLVVYGFLRWLGGTANPLWLNVGAWLLFPCLAFLTGSLGGYQFATAVQVFFADARRSRHPGLLYGLDLIGACVGVLIVSAILLPLFGFWQTALFIAMLNLPPTLLAFCEGRKTVHSLPQDDARPPSRQILRL